MFDVGFMELGLLAIIGLLILGPQRLPQAARTLGKYLRQARMAWNNLRFQIEQELDAEELKEDLKQAHGDTRDSLDDIKQSLDN